MLVGLTGGLGCGKSTVLKIFSRLGAETVSADEIVHALLEDPEVKTGITEVLGESILDAAGEIDRARMAEVIFSHPDKREAVERILHPLVFESVMERHRRMKDGLLVAEIPLLFETGSEDMFHKTVVVKAPEETVKRRLRGRGMSSKDIEARISAQMDLKRKLEKADYVIDNSHDLESTARQVERIFTELTKSSPKDRNGASKPF